MLKRTPRPLFLLLLLLAVASLVAFAACGDDDDDGGGGATTPAGEATTPAGGDGETIDISGVPELEDGMITVGSDIAYPPIEYYEEGTTNAVGLDVDLMKAMAQKLGVDVEFKQVADFAGIVGDLKASRYDVVMSAISITDEREAEIDLIPYFGPAGTGVLVQKGNPKNIQTIEDICGLAVGAQVGTVQIDYLNEFNGDMCADNQIDIREYPDNPTSVQELVLGRIDAQISDDPVAAYSAAQHESDLIQVAVQGFDSAPYGIGVRKDSAELKAVLEQALQAIRDDGTYDSILVDWGQTDLAYQE